MKAAIRARGLALVTLAGLLLATAIAPASVAAATPADKVIAVATAQIGDPWAYGATGPSSFDCSGLVIYSFKQAGYGSVIGNGTYRTARSMYDWFRSRGLASTSGGRRGDLVIYGGGSHVGIYLGDGKVISTLSSGVRIHGLYAPTSGFTAFLHTGMSTTTTSTTWSQVRYTTGQLNMRSGPSTSYSILTVLPYGDKLLATKIARDSLGRTWYYVYSYSKARSGWVAGWYTRAG